MDPSSYSRVTSSCPSAVTLTGNHDVGSLFAFVAWIAWQL